MKTSTKKPPTPPLCLTHTNHDPAHCCVPGLFRPLKRGGRWAKKLHLIHHREKVMLEFRGFEVLGADDLRILQGLLAISPMIENPETGVTAGDIYYQIAKEIGLPTSGANFNRIRTNIERLHNVTIIARCSDGICHRYQLVDQYSSDEKQKQITVVINPRIIEAILGKRIEMAEVRAIPSELTRILHQYLCCTISPGDTRNLAADSLVDQIWPDKQIPTTRQKHRARLKKAMVELEAIGWKCELTADRRAWIISRPKILKGK